MQLSVTAPTVINYKLEPDGTFICPTDATIKNNSSIPIATKSWSVNILTGTADSKDNFVNSSASNAWWNTVSADGGEPSSFNLDTETLYDSWNMAASGQSLNDTQDDTLSLAFDGSMKNIDGSIDYNAGKQLSTVTFTFGTVLNSDGQPKPDPNGIAFAVYSEDDKSLDFYKRDSLPTAGKKFNGKSMWNTSNVTNFSGMFSLLPNLKYLVLDGWDLSKVETGFDDKNSTSIFSIYGSDDCPSNIETISMKRSILPSDCSGLFSNLPKCENIDLLDSDASKVRYSGGMVACSPTIQN